MTAGNDFDPVAEPKLFSALLIPHRSLNRTGFLVLMTFVSVISFAAGGLFWWIGHVVEWVLNPLWVQFEQKSHAEFGIEQLYLVSRGRRVSVGNFLGPEEKGSFAKALVAALNAAKRGPTYNPIN